MTPPSKAPPAPSAFDQLDGLLRELLEANERLLSATLEHRRAMARANAAEIRRSIAAQNEIVQKIAVIEQRRLKAVELLQATGAVEKGSAHTIALSSLLRSAPERVRERISAVAAKLREVLARVNAEHVALKQAAETLALHMEGIMRQVYRQLSHAGTYGRSGVVDTSVRVVSGLDLKS